ncbi:hypothetical protein ACU610_06750 [Geodermatophilus sp. URMC 61]
MPVVRIGDVVGGRRTPGPLHLLADTAREPAPDGVTTSTRDRHP